MRVVLSAGGVKMMVAVVSAMVFGYPAAFGGGNDSDGICGRMGDGQLNISPNAPLLVAMGNMAPLRSMVRIVYCVFCWIFTAAHIHYRS
jgi:ABC-type dipeptide/oligopeptide/nickel transport system permease subunit